MPQKPYPSHTTEAVVRIFSPSGEFFGTGCLTVGGLIVTCAHVIRDALPVMPSRTEPPVGNVGIDFPFLMEGAKRRLSYPGSAPLQARLVPGGWGWTDGAEPCNDIAVLRLVGASPLAAGWYFSTDAKLDQTQSVFVHGFRKGGDPAGHASQGILRANSHRTDGIRPLDTQESAYAVDPGFSGAPVFPTDGAHAVAMLIGAPEGDPSLKEKDGRRIAFVIPAYHVSKRIDAVFAAEAAAKANPPELAVLLAYIPAARARLNEARLQSNDLRLIEGVTYTLDDLEEIGKASLNDDHLKALACVAGHLDRFCREDAGGIGRLLKLVPLDDFVTKLAGFQNKLQQTCPTELIDNDWTKNLPHLDELNALKEEIAVRLQVLEDEPTSFAAELRQKARNALRALRRELHQNPLHLSVIDRVRRELEALDRSLFAELILVSQLLLGRYVRQLPDLAVFRDFREGPEMVVIPAGRFLMGSPPNEKDRNNAEGPQQEVTISQPFAVGRYPVTAEEYAHFCAQTHRVSYIAEGEKRHPVANVNWDDAKAHVAWLSGVAGANYRLLSEAEWEYACRAGTQTRYWFGDEIAKDQANFNGKGITEVGSYPANGFGLYDMHGNVWEWVEDVWHNTLTGVPTDGAAWTKGTPPHVVRGGSWDIDDPRGLRSAFRLRSAGDDRLNLSGFRLARTLSPHSS